MRPAIENLFAAAELLATAQLLLGADSHYTKRQHHTGTINRYTAFIDIGNYKQVRIKVQACGVCHGDSVTKEGLFPSWASNTRVRSTQFGEMGSNFDKTSYCYLQNSVVFVVSHPSFLEFFQNYLV
jgi:hypothetical protein